MWRVPLATFISNVRFPGAAPCHRGLRRSRSLVGIRAWIPRLAPVPDTGLRGQFRFLRSAAPWLIYSGVFFGQMAVYCYFSGVEPGMTQVAGFSQEAMTWIMVLAGAGMVSGNFLGTSRRHLRRGIA